MNRKKASAFLLLFVFTIQTMGSVLMIAEFYMNREYIAKTLCVNKNRPALQCCGKCHLNKQLKEEQQENNSGTPNKFQYKLEVLSSKSFFSQISISGVRRNFHYNSIQDGKIVDMPRSVFHPPDKSAIA